ncbi:MAG TPA: alanine--glyoxylate aminotransferase family protein [Planctomycetota bacterium]|nr:alanine--glyoxylate aminotransferase family protein [Planctomycetota bacterium]
MNPQVQAFTTPERLLLGPGPSPVAPSVLRALAQPTIGHLDPLLLQVQDEISALLRSVYGSESPWTIAFSGTGSSGMEGALVNLIEPGDVALVAVGGFFGARMVDVAQRAGARVIAVEHEWGRQADLAKLRKAAAAERVRFVCAVQAETSTGVRQDLAPLSQLARELDAFFVVDAVTSLGCMAVDCDAQGIDAAYSCSQKGLSCVPGLAPVTFSPRAQARIASRTRPVQSFYLDMNLLMRFWGGERGYHHTISSNLLVALHEALRLVHLEGLEARFERHARIGRSLRAGVRAMGLELFVPDEDALSQVTAIRIPAGVDDLRVRKRLLAEYGIEISGGLGAQKGRLWRVGMMGSGASLRNVVLVLDALAASLRAEGEPPLDSGVEAAQGAFAAGTS